jgi:hypothetical protein
MAYLMGRIYLVFVVVLKKVELKQNIFPDKSYVHKTKL